MNILAVDTSGPCASAAVAADGKILSYCWNENGHTHSDTVIPLVAHALDVAMIEHEALDALAVTIGPGSFTGLRIGISLVKAMAQALDIPCIPVGTLESLCYQAQPAKLRCAIMDARRGEVYSMVQLDDRVLLPPAGRKLEVVLDTVREFNETVVFCGDGVRVYHDQIMASLGDKALFLPEPFAVQQAASVAMLAMKSARATWLNAFSLMPEYLRLSQAEREAQNRG